MREDSTLTPICTFPMFAKTFTDLASLTIGMMEDKL